MQMFLSVTENEMHNCFAETLSYHRGLSESLLKNGGRASGTVIVGIPWASTANRLAFGL